MTARWIAAIAAWLAAAGATVGCAVAWGPSGRWVVLILGALAFLFAAVTTSEVAKADRARGDVALSDRN